MLKTLENLYLLFDRLNGVSISLEEFFSQKFEGHLLSILQRLSQVNFRGITLSKRGLQYFHNGHLCCSACGSTCYHAIKVPESPSYNTSVMIVESILPVHSYCIQSHQLALIYGDNYFYEVFSKEKVPSA